MFGFGKKKKAKENCNCLEKQICEEKKCEEVASKKENCECKQNKVVASEKPAAKSKTTSKALSAKETKTVSKSENKVAQNKKPAKKAEVTEVKAEPKKAPAKKAAAKKVEPVKVEEDKTEEIIVDSTEEKTKKAVYRVAYDKEDKLWKIRKDGAKRVICSFPTKVEAVARVRELCETQELNFTVRKKNGKFQKKANLK